MQTLNLKHFLHAGLMCLLTLILMSFPAYCVAQLEANTTLLYGLCIAFIAISVYICRRCRTERFSHQFLILASLTLSALFTNGAALLMANNDWDQLIKSFALVNAIYSLVLLFALNNGYIRILAILVLCLMGMIGLYAHTDVAWPYYGLLALTLVLLFAAWSKSSLSLEWMIALALCVLGMTLFELWLKDFGFHIIQPQHLSSLLPMMGALPWLLRSPADRSLRITSAAALLIALWFLPLNVVMGAVLVLIGILKGERALHVLGLLLFTVALVLYYYELSWSLQAKGWLLLSTGTVILCVPRILQRILWRDA